MNVYSNNRKNTIVLYRILKIKLKIIKVIFLI